MAQTPTINPFPQLPSPMPFMPVPQFTPPNPVEMDKMLKDNMEKAMCEMVKNPDHDFHKNIREVILNVVDSEPFVDKLKSRFISNHEEKEEYHHHYKHSSPMKALFEHINHHHKEIRDGRTVSEIMEEDKKKHNLTEDEERVYSILLKTDSAVEMAHTLGMSYDTFIEHLECLGKKIEKENEEEEEEEIEEEEKKRTTRKRK